MATGKLFPIQTNNKNVRQSGESAQAFSAYCDYRDLGPRRSLIAAWNAHRAKRAAKRNPNVNIQPVPYCSGRWTHWSSEFDWERRAAAYDRQIDAAKCAARLERKCKLEERRDEFELANQESLEKHVWSLDLLIDKFAGMPITDVVQEKEQTLEGKTTRTKIRYKGIKGGDLAAIIKQRNEIGRLAIEGVRTLPENSRPTEQTKDPGQHDVPQI